MVAELGHFALILAGIVAVYQVLAGFWGAARQNGPVMLSAGQAALTQFLLTALSFAALTYAFVTSDFSLAIVANNSHSAKPMLYKWSGTWGNHEGSMLLWILILTFYGAMVALLGRNLPSTLKARALAVQALVGVGFFAFILLTSNPFVRLGVPPADGADLNPLLQDPGLAFHPPFLYLGYVGFSMAFSFAIAALIEGRVDAAWARWVRPWTLAAWMFLTIGISLGSYWAYYELGWGGWWFWDPVENASLMPWIIGTALLHSAIVVEKREALRNWTILLAIFAFSFSLIGTFIVRSGVLTSVHAFATDPERGIFILAMLVVAIGGSLALYAWRAPALKSGGIFAPVSRESALVLNNVLLSVSVGTVLIGTLWPLIIEALFDDRVSVGPPFFNMTFGPLMICLLFVLPAGIFLPWKRGAVGKIMPRLYPAMLLSALVALGVFFWRGTEALLAGLGLGLAAWVIFGSLAELAARTQLGKARLSDSLRRLTGLPRAAWGMTLAHIGIGITTFGIIAVSAWEVEDIRIAQVGEAFDVGNYRIQLEGVEKTPVGRGMPEEGQYACLDAAYFGERQRNYTADVGCVRVSTGGRSVTRLYPEKRFYPVQGKPTTEAAIRPSLGNDIYIVLGDKQKAGGWTVRTYIKPFANWIWIGTLVMVFGGLLSLSDRRFRVGVPRRRVRKQVEAK